MSEVKDVPIIKTPEERPLSHAIRGEVIIGLNDPRTISEEEFNSSPELLYHGIAKEFTYSHLGKFNIDSDGSEDYGSGLYTTDNQAQAENYSIERSGGILEKPIVYSFLPHQARMLDVRDIHNMNINGVLPNEFVLDWLDCLKGYITGKNKFVDLQGKSPEGYLQDILKRDYEKYIEKITEAMRNGCLVRVRTEIVDEPGIFDLNGNGYLAIPFRKFMLDKGYDGMIYREGGEGSKREALTGYIFYNYQVVDTLKGWQQREKE